MCVCVGVCVRVRVCVGVRVCVCVEGGRVTGKKEQVISLHA